MTSKATIKTLENRGDSLVLEAKAWQGAFARLHDANSKMKKALIDGHEATEAQVQVLQEIERFSGPDLEDVKKMLNQHLLNFKLVFESNSESLREVGALMVKNGQGEQFREFVRNLE